MTALMRFWDDVIASEARAQVAAGTRRRDRFICKAGDAVFDNAASLTAHVEEHRRDCGGCQEEAS